MKTFFAKHILLLFTVTAGLLFLYSFTQIDLGLALTRFPALFSVQRAFQTIGYFNRPLSAALYALILVLMTAAYLVILHVGRSGKLQRRLVWRYIFIVTALLTFAYNAFSYDLFNYIFDAKIVTYYHHNPYEHKALDYPQDPMLGFMHWTHRVYPYGPAWLGLTVPLSFAGFHVFLLTFVLFKLLAAGCFLGTVYFLEKIAEKTGMHALVPVLFFAFNPLVLIESLISGHNDIVMMFFAVTGMYLLLKKRYILSILLMALSVATKFATVFLIPAYLSSFILQYIKVKIPWVQIWVTALGCMGLAVLAASQTSGNFQPWYLLLVLPFAALLAENRFFSYVAAIVTVVIAGTYLPFLYLGN